MEIRRRDSDQHILLIDPPNCETLDLTFTPDPIGWICSGSCKTQFSDWRTHAKIAELLRVLAAFCSGVEIYDEGEYYETRDVGRLNELLNQASGRLERLRAGLSSQTARRPLSLSRTSISEALSQDPGSPGRTSPPLSKTPDGAGETSSEAAHARPRNRSVGGEEKSGAS